MPKKNVNAALKAKTKVIKIWRWDTLRLKPGLEDYITEYCDISDSNKGHVPSSSTYRDVLQSVAVNPSDIRKLVEIGVEYDHLIALLHGTLDVRNLSSLAQTVIHYQPTASHAA